MKSGRNLRHQCHLKPRASSLRGLIRSSKSSFAEIGGNAHHYIKAWTTYIVFPHGKMLEERFLRDLSKWPNMIHNESRKSDKELRGGVFPNVLRARFRNGLRCFKFTDPAPHASLNQHHLEAMTMTQDELALTNRQTENSAIFDAALRAEITDSLYLR